MRLIHFVAIPAILIITAFFAYNIFQNLSQKQDAVAIAKPPISGQSDTSIQAPPSRSEYKVVTERNIFNSTQLPLSQLESKNSATLVPVQATLPPFSGELMGTLVHSNPAKSVAIIRLNGDVKRFHPQEQVDHYTTIHDISRKSVTLDRQGKLETLAVPTRLSPSPSQRSYDAPRSRPTPNATPISQDYLKTYTQRGQIYEDIMALLPETESGKITGFRVLEVNPETIFEMLRLEADDLIYKLDGKAANSIESVIQFFQKGAKGDFTIDVKRNGQPVTLNYTIK